MLERIYGDRDIFVCVKPAGAASEGGGDGDMEALVREASGCAEVHTVHRLDRAVGGLMVYALGRKAAAGLSREITERTFGKVYLAVVHGCPEEPRGRFDDLLFHDQRKNMTYVVDRMRKGVREAALEYEVLGSREGLSLVRIRLLTGRTHQIRAQFASRKMPLAGDRRYGGRDSCGIALWSHALSFAHPATGEAMAFEKLPPKEWPWELFAEVLEF